jgi:hypothetical protein
MNTFSPGRHAASALLGALTHGDDELRAAFAGNGLTDRLRLPERA